MADIQLCMCRIKHSTHEKEFEYKYNRCLGVFCDACDGLLDWFFEKKEIEMIQ